jgi:quercetin dioxygenase-like cupin family protein
MVKAVEEDGVLPAALGAALFIGLRAEPVDAAQAARIRARVEAAIGEAPVSTHRAGAGGWIRRGPHIQIKLVRRDPLDGLCSFLLRLAPDGCIEPHAHRRTEECVIIEGEVEVDGVRLGAGDYQALAAGTRHSRIYSRHGALLFLRAELDLAA